MDATVLALAGLLRIRDGDRTRFEFKELQAPNKKKNNNKKKKKKAPSREEVVVANGGEHSNSNGSSSITWGEVKTFYFKWAIGHCAVPAKGGTPLGLGDEEESMQEQVTVDKHQSLLASSLLVRARERGVPVGSIKHTEKPHGVSSSKGKEDWDVLLETRQRDFKKSNNKNPFFRELIGEIFFVNQRYDEAIYFQKNAMNNLNSDNDIYMMMLGNYLLSSEDKEKVNESIGYLKKSIQINSANAYSWYLLAKAYAYLDNISFANYATAERYFLIGERTLAYDFALKAIEGIEENTPEWYRTYDLVEILQKEVSTNTN